MKKKKTSELSRGMTVATAMVMRGTANHATYVTSAGPGSRGTWRVIEDVVPQPVDKRAENDTLIFFEDGAVAATKSTNWWGVKE